MGTEADQQGRWVEIAVLAAPEAVDDLSALLGRYCQGGAVVETAPADVNPQMAERALVKGFVPEWDQATRLKLEIALSLLSRASPISEPQVRVLAPEDWSESWKAYFSPLHIGRRFVVVPTWRAYDAKPGECIIHLDPGMAFGTGLHPTTRLCLAALEPLVCATTRVLDVGTGSGILAIGATLLGAGEVDALDTDPVAVQVAQANAALNGVESHMRVALGTIGDASGRWPQHRGAGYDLVTANILAEVVAEMAPALAGALRPGGSLVTSGIIASKTYLVTDALDRAGLVLDSRTSEEDWVMLTAHKR